ncbi:Mobile element protein [Azospirillum doebereinerae]
MVESTGALPRLSTVAGKPVHAAFDGGLLLLAEIDRRLGICERLAACIKGPRVLEHIQHTLVKMIRSSPISDPKTRKLILGMSERITVRLFPSARGGGDRPSGPSGNASISTSSTAGSTSFFTQVFDILAVLTDIVQPRTFEQLEQYGFGEDDEEAV